MDKRGKTKIVIFSLIVATVISISFTIFGIAGERDVPGVRDIQEHVPIVTIDPLAATCGDIPNKFTVNIINNGGFEIYDVKIYKAQTNILNLSCGSAPYGWDFDGFKFGLYCQYSTNPLNNDTIMVGENINFTFNAIINESEDISCGSIFRVSTLDNEAIKTGQGNGTEKNSFPTIKVDCIDPNTTKTFIGPQKIDNMVEWIDGVTKIKLDAIDPDPKGEQCNVGVDKTWYANLIDLTENSCLTPEKYCNPANVPGTAPYEEVECINKVQIWCEEHWEEENYNSWEECVEDFVHDECEVDPLWKLYKEPIQKPEESCHMLHYFSIDKLGNVEDMNVNCFFVDKTSPNITKRIEGPKILCENQEECNYFVGGATQINLACEDRQPHPSNDVTIYWRTRYDQNKNGELSDEQWGATKGKNSPLVNFSFTESSLHELEYWCVDAVNKSSAHYFEIDKVDGEAPNITKKMFGSWLGDCPPNSEGDKCFVADNGNSGVEIFVEDPEPLHAVDKVSCRYKVIWINNNESIVVDSGDFSNYTKIIFKEDSTHKLYIYCQDALGNSVEDTETFLVDSTPPITTKTYGEPFLQDWYPKGCRENNGIEQCDGDRCDNSCYPAEFINNKTAVILNATDNKVGVNKTYWRNMLVRNDKVCGNQKYYCNPEYYAQYVSGYREIPFNEYKIPFLKDEESCHVIEYYSVDKLGNKEDMKWQCVFVDNSAPKITKTIGEPNIPVCLDKKNDSEPQGRELDIEGISISSVSDLVGTVKFSKPCSSGTGVGIAYDGTSLWYSCYASSTDLYRADPKTGNVSAEYKVIGGLGALAYDKDRNAIWAGWGGSGVNGNIYLLQLDEDKNFINYTFIFKANSGGMSIDDGLAYDNSDDTLYVSPDVSPTIYHYTTNGTLLGSFAKAGSGAIGNSGLALGGDLLYEGFNGEAFVRVVNKSDTSTVVFNFSTKILGDLSFRDEDLECDTNTFADQGKHVMWSVEAYEPRRAMAFEIPFGSCGVGGKPPEPGPVCNNTAHYVTQQTNITLDCKDIEPHPADHVKIFWRFSNWSSGFNGKDVSYSEWFNSSQMPIRVNFNEDSYHDLEYYCVDGLGNKGAVHTQYYFVEGVPPVTTKTYDGPVYELNGTKWIDNATLIHLDAVDPEPHPSGVRATNYMVELVPDENCWSKDVCNKWDDRGDWKVYDKPFNIPEESCHIIKYYSVDKLGNKEEEKRQCVFADHTKPMTTKSYVGPQYPLGDKHPKWIGNVTLVNLSVKDTGEHKSGIKETKYSVTKVDDGYCDANLSDMPCSEAQGSKNWNTYTKPFTINEQSCHLIEYYSVDNVGKTEDKKRQCTYVDTSAPVPNKTVGEPKIKWLGDNSTFYKNETKHCWDNTGQQIECWKVTTMTPITLDCNDPEPHPVDHGQVCFNVGLDGKDETEKYCNKVKGNVTNGFCCLTEKTFYFVEESEHNLKYYCKDALGNKGLIDEEKFKVTGKSFIIRLNKKWNLVSTPVKLLDDKMDEVFKDLNGKVESLWSYDGEDWHVYTPDNNTLNDDIKTMTPGDGYWILALQDANLTIGGSLMSPAMTPPSKPIVKGWNLVGYYGVTGPKCPKADGYACKEYNGPLGKGGTAACTFNTLGNNVWDKGFTSLWTYWEPYNLEPNKNQWKPLDKDNSLDPGAGYWLFAQEEGIYAPSTTCGMGF